MAKLALSGVNRGERDGLATVQNHSHGAAVHWMNAFEEALHPLCLRESRGWGITEGWREDEV